jgi:hypothetical protein
MHQAKTAQQPLNRQRLGPLLLEKNSVGLSIECLIYRTCFDQSRQALRDNQMSAEFHQRAM